MASLHSVNERGWRMGFANLLRKENGAWWRTRNWLVQSIIWFCVLNGLLATVLWAPVQQQVASQEAREAIRESNAANEAQGAMLDLMQEKPTAGLILFFLMSGIALPLAATVALGAPLPSTNAVLPIIATAVWCIAFAAVSIWRFQREEF